MLLVPAVIGPSQIQGIGLIAAADIKKDTVIWRWDAPLDREIPWSTAEGWPQIAQDFLETYAYRNMENQTWMLAGDDSRFMNHSFVPNTQSSGPYGPDYALRNIKAGEELTVDYRTFDPEFEEYSKRFH